jgi:hypothetical protein
MGDGLIQISMSGAAVLVVGVFALVFGFGLVLLRQFEKSAAARDAASLEIGQTDRATREREMTDLRGLIASESRRIGTISEQIDDLLDIDKRLRVLEEWRRHVPTNDDIDEVKALVGGVSAQVAAIGERSLTTQSVVTRIEQYLLEQK